MREAQNTQEKRNNKRSFVIVALLLLLVAVIGFGGYTLAKYITRKTESGSASVAKWGFTVETDATNLFGTNYKYDTDASKVTAETASLTVKASDKDNRVAPGTTGSMTFSVKGTAEVKAQIAFNLDVKHDVALKYNKKDVADAATYAPVKWTLKKGETVVKENATLAEIATALNTTATYEAGAAEINDKYTLSWAWDFESNNDELDTLLGIYANDNTKTTNGDYTVVADGTDTGIEFTLEISVTQLAK